jgi:hypothetical protein
MKKLTVITLLIISFISSYSQSFILRGTVVDEERKPLQGASVAIKGTNMEVYAWDGIFELTIPDTTKYKTIEFRYIGYDLEEYQITEENDILIEMKEQEPVILEQPIIMDRCYVKPD